MTNSIQKVSMIAIALVAAVSMMLITTTSASASTQGERDWVCTWTEKHSTWFVSYSKPTASNFKYEGPKTLDPRVSSAWCNSERTVDTKPVVFVDPTCEEPGSYTVPKAVGVVYSEEAGTHEAEDGDAVTVEAKAAEMYFLEEEADTEWSHEFVNEEECEVEPTPEPEQPVEEVEEEPQVLAATTQVTTTPTGSADAGGAGSMALIGLAGSAVVLGAGAASRKFARN